MQADLDLAFINKKCRNERLQKGRGREKTFWKVSGNLYQILTAEGIKSIIVKELSKGFVQTVHKNGYADNAV